MKHTRASLNDDYTHEEQLTHNERLHRMATASLPATGEPHVMFRRRFRAQRQTE
jgi:hypothetical protein